MVLGYLWRQAPSSVQAVGSSFRVAPSRNTTGPLIPKAVGKHPTNVSCTCGTLTPLTVVFSL
jgi:hypothetical protein